MSDGQIPEPTAKVPCRGRLWVRVLLFTSLTLNILIVGAVAGAVATRDGPRASELRLRDAGLGPLTTILSQPERDALRGELRARAPAFRENRRQMRKSIGDLLTALRAETFDAARVEAALAQQRGRVADRQALGHQAFVAQLATLDTSQRRALADRIEKALRRGGDRSQ